MNVGPTTTPVREDGPSVPPDSNQSARPAHLFRPGFDPRRAVPGGPRSTTREALKWLEANALAFSERLEEFTKDSPEEDPCVLCGRGMPRNDETKIRALIALLDRTPQMGMKASVSVDDGRSAWIEYLTPEESEELFKIRELARNRLVAAQSASALPPIDVSATVVTP